MLAAQLPTACTVNDLRDGNFALPNIRSTRSLTIHAEPLCAIRTNDENTITNIYFIVHSVDFNNVRFTILYSGGLFDS